MAASKYQIVVISPDDFIYIESWREAIDAMRFGFAELGMEVPVVENRFEPGATPIVFGAHHLDAGMEERLPPGTILYNLEQLLPGYPWHRPHYLALLGRFTVWDFHLRNVEQLRREGINAAARHVPIGYVPQMASVAPATENVDVLFYGVLTERRQSVVKELMARELKVVALRGVFGRERDEWIARAKVVVNLHQQADGYFEALRVLHLMANGKAVVTECDDAEEIDSRLLPGLRTVAYEGLVDACESLARNADQRRALAASALAAVRRSELRMSTILRGVLLG
jgi:hypothetical protein